MYIFNYRHFSLAAVSVKKFLNKIILKQLLGRKLVVSCKFNLKFVFHLNVTYAHFFFSIGLMCKFIIGTCSTTTSFTRTHKIRTNCMSFRVLNAERVGLDSGDNWRIENGNTKLTSNRNESKRIESNHI